MLKGLAFAKEMIRLGHSVEVLTGFPNYPGGKIYVGYRQNWRMRECLDSVTVLRVPVFPDHSKSPMKRIVSYLSFSFSACIPGVFLVKKPDVIHVYQGPATLVLPAIVMKLVFGVPYVLDIQDLWPESVFGSGMFRYKFLTPLLHFWCSLTYRLASKIVVLSTGYKEKIIQRGIAEGKIEVLYNWCDPSLELGVGLVDEPIENSAIEKFSLVYAGNIGSLQALDAVVKAANQLKFEFPELQVNFVGDGIDRERLERMVELNGITNVKFLGRQPVGNMGEILKRADGLLIHLADDPLCRIGIPQKTQAYLAAGKPIIMCVGGDAARLVESAGAGILCQPENPDSIAAAIRQLIKMSPEDRALLGSNGKQYYFEHLSFRVGTKRMEKILTEVAHDG